MVDVKVANTKAPLWSRIAEARDAGPELERLRLVLSKNKEASNALEEFLYSHYHYLLTQQRFESDEKIRNMDVATANAIATIAKLIFEDSKQKPASTKSASPRI